MIPRRFFARNYRLNRFLPKNFSTGLFEIDTLSKPGGFEILEKSVYNECKILLNEVSSPNRRRKMVEIVDDLSNSICKVADLAECVRNLHPDPKFVTAAEECSMRLSTFVENLNTDVNLYNRVKTCINEGDETDKRVASLFAVDFEASGVHLPEKQRVKFVELSSEIYQIGSNFVRGCEEPLDTSTSAKNSSSNRILSYFTSVNNANNPNNENNLDHVIKICGNFGDSAKPNERELGYKLFYAPRKSQEQFLARLIRLRHDLARVAGFQNFAQRSLRGSILQTPEAVETFLMQLIECLRPKVEKELNILQSYSSKNRSISIWDLPYLRSLYRQEQLNHVLHKLKNRFDIESTLEGIKKLIGDLYGVVLKRIQPKSGEVWHQDVEKLLAYDKSGNFVGTIYCDWYDRPNKTSSDSHFTVRCGKQLTTGSLANGQEGDYQQPVVVLAFRYNKNASSSRDEFNFAEMSNILHEFGHAMHSILGRTKYQHVSGTRCSTDFAEIPSNLMELYLLDERTFLSFSDQKSRDTNLNNDDVTKIITTFNAFSSLDTMQQAIYALFDLRLHWKPPPFGSRDDDQSTIKAFDRLCQDTWPFMHVPGTAWHHRFSHLVAYGCKYHAYLVARAAASLIWRQLFAQNPRDRSAGESWGKIQSYGGELEPSHLLNLVLNKHLTSSDLSHALSLEK